jgi:hypothetical protein
MNMMIRIIVELMDDVLKWISYYAHHDNVNGYNQELILEAYLTS